MHGFLRFLRSLALYVALLTGGVTLFLVLSPLFGYLPYSDRPGPGWFGTFPAIGWRDFWANAWEMVGTGLFLGLMAVIPCAVAVLIVRAAERWVRRPMVVRFLSGFLAALFAGYWMLGAGWYIAAGFPLLIVAVILGAAAGVWVVPDRSRKVVQGV